MLASSLTTESFQLPAATVEIAGAEAACQLLNYLSQAENSINTDSQAHAL